MKNKSLKKYATFMYEVGALAQTPRTGFRHLGGWRWSIAEHLCRTAYIGLALAREVQEELGVSAVVGEKIAETPGDVAGQVIHWYRVVLTSEEFNVDEQELAHVGWFTKEQMQSMKLWPATKSFFDTYILN